MRAKVIGWWDTQSFQWYAHANTCSFLWAALHLASRTLRDSLSHVTLPPDATPATASTTASPGQVWKALCETFLNQCCFFNNAVPGIESVLARASSVDCQRAIQHHQLAAKSRAGKSCSGLCVTLNCGESIDYHKLASVCIQCVQLVIASLCFHTTRHRDASLLNLLSLSVDLIVTIGLLIPTYNRFIIKSSIHS